MFLRMVCILVTRGTLEFFIYILHVCFYHFDCYIGKGFTHGFPRETESLQMCDP